MTRTASCCAWANAEVQASLTELYLTEKGGELLPAGFTQIDAVPCPVEVKSPSQGICLTGQKQQNVSESLQASALADALSDLAHQGFL